MLVGVCGWRRSNNAKYIGEDKVEGSIHIGGDFIQVDI